MLAIRRNVWLWNELESMEKLPLLCLPSVTCVARRLERLKAGDSSQI